MKTIFDYSDPNTFLRDKWTELKLKNPHLSVRSWAQFLEMGAHSPLHQMILGNRKISQSYVPKFVKYFDLNNKEALYFDLLVKFSKAQTIEETNFHLEKLKELRPKKEESVEILDNYEIQKEPLHFFIMERAELADLPNDFKIVREKLAFNYTSFEVKTAIQLLIDAGQLMVNENNMLVKTHKHLYSAQDKKNLALVQYHQKASVFAQSAVSSQEVLEREFNGTSFNIDKNQMNEIKAEMRSFLKLMIEKYEQPAKQGDATYQLNLQFFKVAEL